VGLGVIVLLALTEIMKGKIRNTSINECSDIEDGIQFSLTGCQESGTSK
jgi:hypothetical protein